jgi:hypothetical protein
MVAVVLEGVAEAAEITGEVVSLTGLKTTSTQ